MTVAANEMTTISQVPSGSPSIGEEAKSFGIHRPRLPESDVRNKDRMNRRYLFQEILSRVGNETYGPAGSFLLGMGY